MNRAHTIQFCEKCIKRGFSPKSGIICSLTDAPANFETTCLTFEEDEKEARRIELLRQESAKATASNETFGMSKVGIANPVVAGVALMVAATAWFFIGLFYLNRIFYYPPVLFIFGIIALAKGIGKNKATRRKIQKNDSVLDDF